MAKLGLLGALGGLGSALQDTGKFILARRERALEAARQEAEAQRRFLERQQLAGEQRAYDTEKTTFQEGRRDARTQAQIDASAARDKGRQSFQSQERVAGQQFQASQKERDIEAQKDLARLRSSLQKEESAASARLQDQLSADNVHAVQYGEPNAQGYAEVIVILKDGTTRKTGQRVYRPKKDEEEEGEAL